MYSDFTFNNVHKLIVPQAITFLVRNKTVCYLKMFSKIYEQYYNYYNKNYYSFKQLQEIINFLYLALQNKIIFLTCMCVWCVCVCFNSLNYFWVTTPIGSFGHSAHIFFYEIFRQVSVIVLPLLLISFFLFAFYSAFSYWDVKRGLPQSLGP